jgi:transcriptional regulator with XRE-family HTH domain
MAQGVKERLIAFLKNEGLSQAKFERICGFSNGYVNNIRNGIGADKLQTILCKFPALNANWLVNGEGEMSAPSQRAGDHSVVIGNHNHHSSIDIDNRQYYSDSPDVLRAQIELLDERIKEKDAQIKEKDAQIKEKDAQINRLLSILEKQ